MSKDEQKALEVIPTTIKPSEFKHTQAELIRFVKNQLKESKIYKKANGKDAMTPGDFGIIPFTNKKSLLLPGAHKLLKLFGFVAKNELVKEIEDWEHRFIYYRYRCTITHGATGLFIADITRSCNSREKKHTDRDIYDVANTIESVAQKRALVAATVQATMASEIFDADTSETEEEAPHKTITEDQDPRRIRVLARLFASASERGFSETQVKNAAYKEFAVTSLKDISTQKAEEFTEKIMSSFMPVGDGEQPKKYEISAEPSTNVQPEPISNFCRQCKKLLEDSPEDRETAGIPEYFCDFDCQSLYYPTKSKTKLDQLIEKGKKNNEDKTGEASEGSATI